MQKNKNSSLTTLTKGNEALRNRDYEAAIRYYNRAMAENPELAAMLQCNLELAHQRYGKTKPATKAISAVSIDIVVPVHNALEDVKLCLQSLACHTDGFEVRVLVVNDGSDTETTTCLREYCKGNTLFHLIEHPVNKGYTCTVNTGLRSSTADYVITQNSDTIVPAGWLAGMVRCMMSDPKIGVVGPLSNAATWQNVPKLRDESGGFAVNDLPPGHTVDSMAQLVASVSHRQYPRLPFVNGFCFMIRRAVIEAIGYMDEKNFPVGYGEENDFCIRATDAGFGLAIADDVYVYHAKSKSFGHDRRKELSLQGVKNIKKKFTSERINQLNEIANNSPVLNEIRSKINGLIKSGTGFGEVRHKEITTEEINPAIRSGEDAFMLRILRPKAKIAVAIFARDDAILSNSLNKLADVDFEHDLFILGHFDKAKNSYSPRIKSVTHCGLCDDKNVAKNFLKLTASNIFDEYSALLWIDQDENKNENWSEINTITERFTNDPGWGVCASSFRILNDERVISALRIAIPRLGLSAQKDALTEPHGSMVWIKPLLLRGLAASVSASELSSENSASGFPGRSTVLSLVTFLASEAGMDVCVNSKPKIPQAINRDLKTLAFYLPQFHPIPENDLWWGKGFTEWANVTRARQMFRGHYQPRVPTELGYYDLRVEETQLEQAKLASEFGIHGFCFYYYWFDGRKLLNHPIEQFAKSKSIDTGFCVCWANENWSRNWDGQNRHVLLEQTYTLESNINLILELIPMMEDPRWVRHHGKPVMLVYRISIIPNWLETAKAWREKCCEAGLGEIHLCAVRFGKETLTGTPQDHGLDAYVIFPPHESTRKDLKKEVLDLHKDHRGEIFEYKAVVDGDLQGHRQTYEWPVHRGAMMGWDNTARRLTDARVFHGATPYGFRRWIKGILDQEQNNNENNESLIFVNAWNEWAEGTYLEPDQRWGRSYLRAYKSAVDSTPGVRPVTLPEGVSFLKSNKDLLDCIGNPIKNIKLLAEPVWHGGRSTQNLNRPTVMLCAHISGQHLFGGERSFLDVLKALYDLPINILVTLPSGNNLKYVEEICKYSLGVYVLPYTQWRDNRFGYAWLTTTFADIIAKHAIDVVYANTIVLIEPLEAASRMKRTRVIHARELISLDEQLQKQVGLDISNIMVKVYDRSDWIIANSRATEKLFWRKSKTAYVPNAVSIEDFDTSNRFGRTIKFGIVSSNIPKKGVADFVEVARRTAEINDRAKFVIIGPINEQIKLWQQEVIRGDRPDNLVIGGYADNPRTAMSQINVLLSLSHFAESFGRTVAEAMASRRPVIAYDWGAVSELVQHDETGYLIPYRNIDGVVGAVVSLCENDNLITSMGEVGRKYVSQHFAQATLKSTLSDAFTAIIARPIRDQQSTDSGLTTAQKIGLPPARTTIIVPVYNAPEAVRDCIRSVLEHTDLKRERLLVIDDDSADPDVSIVLSEFKDKPGITILKNDENIGYTKTINRGIRESGDDDVVLLNSDTVVTPRWLEGLRCAAYSAPKIGTVTAMSDNAGAFSFPKFNEYCPRPDHMPHDVYALLITQATQYCKPPEVPTGSGFCFYIRRAMLKECGLFDEEGFPRGYGEENDFCMRGLQAGWKNLISPWSFVYHIRTASFKGEKAALVQAGVNVVTKRYPDYAKLVKEAFSRPMMTDLRNAASKVQRGQIMDLR